MNKDPAASSGAQSARGPQKSTYSLCLQMPATARAHLNTAQASAEVPLSAPAKPAQAPASARPLVTPRGVAQQTQGVADATPVKLNIGATDSNGTPYIPPAGTLFEYDGGSSVVLSPHTDTPSEKEVTDYAQWLGLDSDSEKDLAWLAKEALMAPLPPYWRPCNTQDGEVYYFNFATGANPLPQRPGVRKYSRHPQPPTCTMSRYKAFVVFVCRNQAPSTSTAPSTRLCDLKGGTWSHR